MADCRQNRRIDAGNEFSRIYPPKKQYLETFYIYVPGRSRLGQMCPYTGYRYSAIPKISEITTCTINSLKVLSEYLKLQKSLKIALSIANGLFEQIPRL